MSADEVAEANYQAALKAWAGRKLTADGVVFETIESVEVECSTGGGCPTCGSWPEIDITVRYDGTRRRYDYGSDIDGLLLELIGGAS